jgi:hypothetical protein
MSSEPAHQLSIRIPDTLHQAAKERGEAEDRSMAWIICTALRQYLAGFEPCPNVGTPVPTTPTDGA